ncbi:MAG: DNA methyltransferase [Marmoricola sp.]
MADKNRLYYGDNLDVLRTNIKAETVDLVYLDPPFNSNRNYNVIFGKHVTADGAAAQIEAFGDTWVWTPATEEQYQDLLSGAVPNKVADALIAMRGLLTENDAMAYLVNMAPRLVELHRVLKSTGSFYLHCDPTMSHYLKVLLDAIFGPEMFRNEIIWRRTGSHAPRRSYGPLHDVILFYVKSNDYTFNVLRKPYTRMHVERRYQADESGRLKFVTKGNILTGAGATGGESGAVWRGFDPSASGRHWAIPGYLNEQLPPELQGTGVLERLDALYERDLIEIEPGGKWPYPVKYLGEDDGTPIGDIWAYQPGTGAWGGNQGDLYGTDDGIDEDVAWLGTTDPERLGYPTQKPVGLLERILRTSSNPGDVVLDPFCGCGTTIDAAQRLGRRWLGIDITYIAVDLINKRLIDRFGAEIADTYEVSGIPRDKAAALALFSESPFDFERWAVSLINGQPNQKQVGDKGVDGVARFPLGDPNKKARQVGQVLISVKGGKHIGPQFVRDLLGTVNTQHAEMGVLITMTEPTRGVVDAVNHAGTYTHPANGQTFPKVQVITVSELLAGKRPKLPLTMLPYVKASKSTADHTDEGLF